MIQIEARDFCAQKVLFGENLIQKNNRKYQEFLNLPYKGDLETFPDQYLDLLIPPKLLGTVARPERIRIVRVRDVWFGGKDQEYRPSILAFVVEPSNISPNGATSDDWDQKMNRDESDAIRNRQISKDEKVLMEIQANDLWNPRKGVEVESFILRSNLRKRGIGEDFYRRFEGILRKMNYQYLFGSNNPQNIQFFLKQGRILLSDLNEEGERLVRPNLKKSGICSIKFLERETEEQFVQKELLVA